MTSRDFCFWLQGYLEISAESPPGGIDALSPKQVECIQKHLSLVFKHEIDPSMGDEKEQEKLNKIHGPGRPPKDLLLRC